MASAAAGNNAVEDALALGQIECARLLLKEGSPLDVERAAKVVIDKGQYEALKFLLSNYNLEVDKHFLLHRALVAYQEDISKLLVESGAGVNNCKEKPIYKDRIRLINPEQGCAHYSHILPLQLSLFCSLDMTRFLLNFGADVNKQDYSDATTLIFACGSSVGADRVVFLLENGAKVHVSDTNSYTALHWAVCVEDIEKLKILLKYGANTDAMYRRKKTPLMLACSESYINVECIKLLLKNKALPNVTDINGNTALHMALYSGDTEKVKILVHYRADVNAMNRGKKTPLMLACAEKSVNVECVKLLLENKALLNVSDISGDTALHKALHSGDIEKLKILVQYGADVNVTDRCEMTPLMLACSDTSVNVECVKLLLENKALPNVSDISGDTALHMALHSGDIEKLKILVQYGADVNVTARCKETPLMLACAEKSDNIECVKFLLENKALLNVSDISGDTALHRAVYSRDIEKLKILVQYGAEINARNENKETPLILACEEWRETTCFIGDGRCERSKIIKFLVEHGADLEARTSRGETPFLTAVRRGNRQLIELLHDLGADVSAEDGEGQNAIMLAIKNRNRISCDLGLLQHWVDKGVSVNHRDKNGWTPLILAAKYKNLEIIKCLVKAGADVNVVGADQKLRGVDKITALSTLLDDRWLNHSGCTEELIRHGAVNSLPERYNGFLHQMIHIDNREMIQLLLTNGMPPTMSNLAEIRGFGSLDPVSPLTVALAHGNIPVIQYLLGNLMLCPSDNYGHSYFNQWRHRLTYENMTDVVRMMDEFYSQPKSLFQLTFVTISHALGGVPGRVDRVNSLPLPSKVKDKLLFKSIDVPLDLTKQLHLPDLLTLELEESDSDSDFDFYDSDSDIQYFDFDIYISDTD